MAECANVTGCGKCMSRRRRKRKQKKLRPPVHPQSRTHVGRDLKILFSGDIQFTMVGGRVGERDWFGIRKLH